jgi:hypothetical protein
MGPGGSPREKRLGRVADHSLPHSAEVKNKLSYTSTPPYLFMAWWEIFIIIACTIVVSEKWVLFWSVSWKLETY